MDTNFILGMAKSESAVKILLNIDKVLSADFQHEQLVKVHDPAPVKYGLFIAPI